MRDQPPDSTGHHRNHAPHPRNTYHTLDHRPPAARPHSQPRSRTGLHNLHHIPHRHPPAITATRTPLWYHATPRPSNRGV